MKPPRIFIQLGRAGDILNILPLVKRYRDQTGEKPYLQVAVEFTGLLDGVSYCHPLVWYGPWDYPLAAMREAHQVSPDIVLCQIHGAGLVNPRQCDSFAREAWHSANADVPWGSLPLEFDRRDAAREARLVDSSFPAGNKRKVVLFAGLGRSSPFPHAKYLLARLRADLGAEYVVIDLSTIKAERFYDMLGLFERAYCLVSIDTAHQHLAAACPDLPVIALCTRDPSPWHGSPWRPQHIARFYYDEFPMVLQDVVNEVVHAQDPQLEIIHVWADWRTNPDAEARRRARIAQASWETEYRTRRWISREVKRADTLRDGTVLGDPHNVNFVHDTIAAALELATSPLDIIALTNADIGFTPGLTGRVLDVIRRHGAAFTHRRDHARIDRPFISEAEVRHGEFYPGSDAFFFTVAWWEEHRAEYGDFVMGREHWDETLRQLIKFHAGGAIEHAVWHEWHESFWSGENRWTMPGNVHNERIREEWFARTGFVPEDFRYFRVVEGGADHLPPYPNEPGRAP